MTSQARRTSAAWWSESKSESFDSNPLQVFELQANRLKINKADWVSQLIPLLPSDVVQIIAREPEKESSDYDYVKELLLRRFKLSAETFRLRFMQQQKKKPEGSWRDLAFELRSFLEEWLEGLSVKDFDSLKDLMVMVSDQMKRRAGVGTREHFIDSWSKIASSSKLADILDEYDSVRGNKNTATLPGVDKKRASLHFEKKGAPFHKTNTEYKRPVSPRDRKQEHPERCHCFECGSTQHLRVQCPKINQKKNRARVNHMAGRRMEATNPSERTPEAREDVVESLPSPGSILTARLKASEKETVQTSPLQKIQVKVGTKTFEGFNQDAFLVYSSTR
ncbi:hypothetical protein AVEN_270115-1 [Araneus ventricosus]|uniref:CCHC-type domain-containing protein n=1 Tax=Araneus ventricosus TaxID=182803 RepID=A0A4Y2KG03_ARAVE|nr:hypothetical protein AVEN_270115-1 [Araneus ventricosus]